MPLHMHIIMLSKKVWMDACSLFLNGMRWMWRRAFWARRFRELRVRLAVACAPSPSRLACASPPLASCLTHPNPSLYSPSDSVRSFFPPILPSPFPPSFPFSPNPHQAVELAPDPNTASLQSPRSPPPSTSPSPTPTPSLHSSAAEEERQFGNF